MRTRLATALIVLCVAAPAWAERVMTFDEALALALAGPRGAMAAADTAAARARQDEALAARLPQIKVRGYLAPSPEIHCVTADCTRTDPEGFEVRLSGVFGGGSLSAIQGLYTFGKLDAASDAARAGVDAQKALERAVAGDVAVDLARAYWGVALARELGGMLDDGMDDIGKALTRLEERVSAGDATIQDRQRIETLLAEVRIQREEARQGEATAVAALRTLTAATDASAPALLDRAAFALDATAGADQRAVANRPEVAAARAGARAAQRLADLEAKYYLPNLALVGALNLARAQGVADAPSALIKDPYNDTSGLLALVLDWQIEPWTTRARTARARAAARKAKHLVDYAESGAAYEAATALAEATSADTRCKAAEAGEKSARAWLAAVLQADAIGTAEAKDLADAYIAWFLLRARLLSATYQWNVATIRVRRARGEFAPTARRLTPAKPESP